MSLREQPNFMTGPRTKLPQAKRSESGKAGNSGAMFLLGEMHEEGREEQVGEVGVEVAEPRIEHQIMRQDRW